MPELSKVAKLSKIEDCTDFTQRIYCIPFLVSLIKATSATWPLIAPSCSAMLENPRGSPCFLGISRNTTSSQTSQDAMARQALEQQNLCKLESAPQLEWKHFRARILIPKFSASASVHHAEAISAHIHQLRHFSLDIHQLYN